MRPYDTYLTVDGSGNVTLIDADGTERVYQRVGSDYHARKERDKLSKVGSEYILTRFNGHKWIYDDTTGLLKKITSRTGREITITRDGNDNITKVTDGNMTKETDARGNATLFTYDAANRQTQIDMPGGNQILLAYWEPGMLKSETNKEGTTETTVDFEYDGFNRLKKRVVSGTDIEFEYYKNDLRKTMKDASGEKRYYYDMAQRLTKVEQGPQGFVIGTDHRYVLEYVWNAASQVTQKEGNASRLERQDVGLHLLRRRLAGPRD